MLKSNIKNEEINYITRMGPKSKDDTPVKNRGVLVMLTTIRRKINLMSLKSNLKGTKINLAEHFSEEIMNKRKPLLEEAKKLRQEGKYAVVKYDKLVCMEKTKKTDKTKDRPSTSRVAAGKRLQSESPEVQRKSRDKKTSIIKKTRKTQDEEMYHTDSEEFEINRLHNTPHETETPNTEAEDSIMDSVPNEK
ncbi:hypothetical protein WDU94_013983 [Cyamophila willieti]